MGSSHFSSLDGKLRTAARDRTMRGQGVEMRRAVVLIWALASGTAMAQDVDRGLLGRKCAAQLRAVFEAEKSRDPAARKTTKAAYAECADHVKTHQAEMLAAEQANAADPRTRRVAFSALLCGWAADEAEALHEIAEHRKAAKIGGVINLSEINKWQDEVMRARRHETRAKAELKAMKAKPLACKDPAVARLAPCMTDDVHSADECDAEAQTMRTIAREDE
jgi:hypothetical protein